MAIQKKLLHISKITPDTKKNRPKTVAEIKRKYRYLPLHFLFGIEKEIDYQCPSLDEYLVQLEEVKTVLEKIRRCKSLEMAKIHAASGLHSIATLPDNIDVVTRTNFEKIRRTAESWKQLAIEAIDETKDPNKFLKI